MSNYRIRVNLGKTGKTLADLAKQPPPVNSTRRTAVPDNAEGIQYEIARMKAIVKDAVGDALIIRLARTIAMQCPSKDKICQIGAIHQWLIENTYYINDPIESEVVYRPARMIMELESLPEFLDIVFMERKRGSRSKFSYDPRIPEDCDGIATLSTSLFLAAGVNSVFVFGGNMENGECNLKHVWVRALSDTDWIDVDATEPNQPLGWHFPYFDCYAVEPIFE